MKTNDNDNGNEMTNINIIDIDNNDIIEIFDEWPQYYWPPILLLLLLTWEEEMTMTWYVICVCV